MKRFLLIATQVLTLAACSESQTPIEVDQYGWTPATESDLSQVKDAFMEGNRLKDPLSMQFSEVHKKKAEPFTIYCGKYIAKNSFGAYTGFKVFAARKVGLTEHGSVSPIIDYLDSGSLSSVLDKEDLISGGFAFYAHDCRDAPENRHHTDESFKSMVESYKMSE